MATQRSNRWQGVVYDPKLPGGRARRQFETRKEAEAWEIDTKSAVQNGRPVDMGDNAKRREGIPYTMGDLCEYVCKHHWANIRSGSDACFNARQVVALIGTTMPIHKVGKAEVDRLQGAILKSGNSKATCNRKLAALSKMMVIAHDLDIVQRKLKVVKFKESESRVRRFTSEEERLALAFFTRTGNADMADLVTVLLDTGLRLGEALGLTQENLVAGKVQVWGDRSKSGKNRTVPLTPRSRAILEGRCRGREVRLWGMSRHVVDHQWNRLRDTLNLEGDPHFVPHILRHEFCSRLADNGQNAPVIKELAGHSSLIITQRYIHINGDALAAAIEGLSTYTQSRSPRVNVVAETHATDAPLVPV